MVDKIITLDSGKEYCILNEINYDGKRYCLGVEYFENTEDVGEEYNVFEEVANGNEIILESVSDKELAEYLTIKISQENDLKNDI